MTSGNIAVDIFAGDLSSNQLLVCGTRHLTTVINHLDICRPLHSSTPFLYRPQDAVGLDSVNAATRLLTSVAVSESLTEGINKNKKEYHLVLFFIFGFHVHNRCRSKKPYFIRLFKVSSNMFKAFE